MKLLLSAMAVVAAAGFSVRLVLNMSKCYGDNVCHMLIIETVEYIFAFSARFNQSFVFQQLKLMRDGGHRIFILVSSPTTLKKEAAFGISSLGRLFITYLPLS